MVFCHAFLVKDCLLWYTNTLTGRKSCSNMYRTNICSRPLILLENSGFEKGYHLPYSQIRGENCL